MKSILHAGRASARDRVSVAADALAEVTAARWRREAAKRRITVDNPVPVRWEWVPGSVPVPLAGRLEQPAGQQDAGLRRCSGRVTELFDEVYGRLPGSRLVVTGAAGAGKSAAMIMLMLTALEQRAALDGAEAGQLPVPVWLSLARWDPVADGLLDWAAATMRREYLFPRGYGPGLSGELLRSGRVALFLDGFDELPVGVRERALALIEALPQGLRVVLTSRAEQYRQARCRVEVAGATVIELWPVSPGDASAYLRAAPARRRPGACADLADYLDRCPGSAAARALDTPLALSLAGAALADGHGEFADFLGTPQEEAAVQVLVARQMLVRAYPDEASRDRAVSALTWLAGQMADGRDLLWWKIPGWVPRRRMNAAYALAAALAGGVGFFGDGSLDGGAMACLTATLVGAVIAGFGTLASGEGQQLFMAPSVPRVIVPRWPRGWRAWAALGSSALVTFLFAGTLVVTLSAPVHVLSSTPGGSYRASRRRSVILLLSWALVGGGMLAGLILACGGPLLVAVAGLAVMTGAGLATLFTPGFFAVKLAELVFRPGPQSRLQVHRLLEDGLTRQVLRQENAACQFRSPELASYLAASHLAALTAQTGARARHEQRKAATVAAGTGPAARLLAKLTPPFTARLAADVAGGITALVFVGMLAIPVPGGLAGWIPWVALALAAALTRSDRLPPRALRWMPRWRLPSTSEIKRRLEPLATPRGRLLSQAGALAFAVVIAVLGAVARPVLQYLWPAVVLLLSSLLFLCARAAARQAASGLVRVLRWSLAADPWPAWKRIALLAATGGVIVLTAGLAGPASLWDGVAATLVWLLPAALTLAVGGWLTLLARRKTRTSTRRRLAYAADVLIALVTGCTVLLLVNPRLLGALPAAGLLFPPAAWLAFRGWRAMSGSRRVTIKAAADIVFSLAAGADIVLALAWAASLLDMPAWEVALVRRLGQQAGAVDDLPWWLWGGLYLLLAAATLALIRWPEHLRRLRKPLIASPLVPVVDAVRRVLTGAHIALLVAVLVGLAAPAAVRPVLRGQLSDKYTVTMLDNLGARGEIAAYQVVQRWLRSAPRRQLSPLASLVTDVQQTAGPGAGRGDASSTELNLARRLGRIQATALALDPARPLSEGEGDAASLSEQASRVQSAEHEETNVGKELHQAAELAVAALSNVLGISRLTDNGAYQVLQEYLGSLIESSPLKDVFAEWAGRVAGAIRPPAAAPMVVPDPGNLERASAADLAAQRSRTPVADPAAASRDISRMEADDPIAAAVKLANQARYLQQDAGPCAGCAPPQPADDQGHTGNQDDQPEHPYIPEIP